MTEHNFACYCNRNNSLPLKFTLLSTTTISITTIGRNNVITRAITTTKVKKAYLPLVLIQYHIIVVMVILLPRLHVIKKIKLNGSVNSPFNPELFFFIAGA